MDRFYDIDAVVIARDKEALEMGRDRPHDLAFIDDVLRDQNFVTLPYGMVKKENRYYLRK
jgi:hypothetical protein